MPLSGLDLDLQITRDELDRAFKRLGSGTKAPGLTASWAV